MFRSSQALQRLASRGLLLPTNLPVPRLMPRANPRFQPNSPSSTLLPRAQTHIRLFTDRRDASSSNQFPDAKHEKDIAKEKIEARPDEVSSKSTVRSVIEPSSSPGNQPPQTTDSLKKDINTIKETFRLSDVPREPQVLGVAGTVPYLATSLSTVFLAWNLTKQLPTGNSFYDLIFLEHDTAQKLLTTIEPIQLGYGAVIISFLGAIHWGLEFAESKPLRERTRFRYGVGVAASIIAWPTLFLPTEYALTSQFMALIGLYFVDARASIRGWAPAWYATYRWLLTAIVGFAVLISLVGRAKIGQEGRLTKKGLDGTFSQSGIADNKTDWAKLEQEEMDKARREKQEAEKKEKQASKNKTKEVEQGSEAKNQKEEKQNKEQEQKGQKKNDKEAKVVQTQKQEGQADDNSAERDDNKSSDGDEKGAKQAGSENDKEHSEG